MKERILHTASDLFLTVGFKNTTMDDICNKLGISKKTIYCYYKNKTELVKSSVFYFLEVLKEGIDSIAQKKLNPILEIYEIEKFFTQDIRIQKTDPAHFQLKKYYPRIYQDMIEHHFNTTQRYMLNYLQRGIKQGYFRENLNTDFISRLYFTIVIEINNINPIIDISYDKNERNLNFIEYHIRAISTEKGKQYLESYLKENNLINHHS